MSSSSEQLKLSGQKIPLPSVDLAWSFSVRPGGWVIALRQRPDGSLDRRRLMLSESRGKVGVSLLGKLWFGEVSSTRKDSGGALGGGDSDLCAQFPGKVRKILVQTGDEVKEGESLLLVEAMKMEFAVKAPFAGKIKRMFVIVGQQLSPGDRFLDLEP